jgi:DNA mismatch repair protein MSH6
MERLADTANAFESSSVRGLLRSAPDLNTNIEHIRSMYTVLDDDKTFAILPTHGADDECDDAQNMIDNIENQLSQLLSHAKRASSARDIAFWHSAQGNKEIYQIEVPANTKVPRDWTKCGGTKVRAKAQQQKLTH